MPWEKWNGQKACFVEQHFFIVFCCIFGWKDHYIPIKLENAQNQILNKKKQPTVVDQKRGS